MNILIAPNSLKNAANAVDIARAIDDGLHKAIPDATIRMLPIADGGEYTLEIILLNLGGVETTIDTIDPLGRPIKASYGITDDKLGIIELSKASGYEFLQGKRDKNPLLTSTYGTGMQIRDAIDKGCRKFLLTLGGSATVDGGAGILQALGVRLLDKSGQNIPHGGGNLLILDVIDTSGIIPEAEEIEFTILCDVTNPLLGDKGAAVVFAPQKGAEPIEAAVLERCLLKFGDMCEEYSGKNLIEMEGAGAAGGVAVGLGAFFDINLTSGTEYILDLQDADKQIKWADVVITAEGSLDTQTFGGKGPFVLANKVKKAGKKMICLAGSVPHRFDDPDQLFDAVFSLQNKPIGLEEAIDNTLVSITNVAFEIGRLLK